MPLILPILWRPWHNDLGSALSSVRKRVVMAMAMIETSASLWHATIYGVGAWTMGTLVAFFAVAAEPDPNLRLWLGFAATVLGASVPLYATWARRQREKEEARLRTEASRIETLEHQAVAREAVIAALKIEITTNQPPLKPSHLAS